MRFPKEDLSFTQLNIRHKSLGERAQVLLPEGSIDSGTAEEFRKKLDEALQKEIHHILVDMASVKYLSSMGLGAIISAMHKAKQKKVGFSLYDSQPSVKRVLEIARLDFLELKPQDLGPLDVFSEYISHEEEHRQKIRQSREAERHKREAELSKKK